MDTAIILAAGAGTKIWPYGEFRQKCTLIGYARGFLAIN